MQLLTPELEARFAEVGDQEGVDDPIVIAKFFDPSGRWTAYAYEYDPEDRVFFGYVVSPLGPDCDELGYFSLDEIATTRGRLGLGMERDLWWTECPLSSVMEGN